MYKFDDQQHNKILASLQITYPEFDALYAYIIGQGYVAKASRGLDYAYLETFYNEERGLTVVFMLLFSSVKAEHGRWSVSVMDHVERNDKYYGHNPTELLEEIKGKI